ncbi:MAG: hypothetical protein IT373_32485 [Polyangiaceae bacterium]|nr:hypothetical protein [Polyangiaceae bacterium]
MHPGFFGWWRRHHQGGCGWGGEATCGTGGGAHGGRCGPHEGEGGEARHAGPGFGGEEGGGFGVRRPLRFLAYKLELGEDQIAKLAVIMNDLKTERAQAAVDQRRRTTALADAIEGSTFGEAKVAEAVAEDATSTARLQAAIAKALGAIHAVLDDAQRRKLAYLLRTGQLLI